MVFTMIAFILSLMTWYESYFASFGATRVRFEEESSALHDRIAPSPPLPNETILTPAAKYNITLHILTYKRAYSLRRLIASARHANYTHHYSSPLEKVVVNIHVCVDRNRLTHQIDNETLDALEEERARWTLGDFQVDLWPSNVGLTEQWINCWKAERSTVSSSSSTPSPLGIHIILEDDLELSPYYHLWFIAAHEAFRNDTKVASVTGSRPWIQARGNTFMQHVLTRLSAQRPTNLTVIKYRLMSPWSLSPKVEDWADFRQFYNWNKQNPRYNPRLPGVKLDHWYQTARREAIEENKPCAMWEMHYVVFMQMHRSYTVYPWVFEDGIGRTVAGNHLESGLHYHPASSSLPEGVVVNETEPNPLLRSDPNPNRLDTTETIDTPLITKPFLPSFENVPCLGWDGEEEPCVHPGWHWKLTYETDEELAEDLALKKAGREKARKHTG